MNTYNLQENEYKTEENTICNIMHNNDFPIYPYHTPPPRQTTITPDKRMTATIQKWATFTYIGKEPTYITNLFKKTNTGIALRTNNTIQKLLMQRKQTSDKYAQSGLYKLICPDCNKAYVGQTGRSVEVRFSEHKNAFKKNSYTSNFAKHLIEQAHSFSSIQNTMQILQRHNKGAHLNTIEQYYIYAEFTKNYHLNDEHNIFLNKIFDALLEPHQP